MPAPLKEYLLKMLSTNGVLHNTVTPYPSNHSLPMKLLNITDGIMGNWPEGLSKDYQYLFKATA